MKAAAVIGHPIKHSRSPIIHSYWLKHHQIEGRYDRIDVPPEELAQFFEKLGSRGLAGCNVTLPHKEEAARLISKTDARARRTGSVNTVYLRHGELHATSTDGYGFFANLAWRAPGFSVRGEAVLILGAGGSAKAIVDELIERGASKVYLANRTISRGEELAHRFGTKVQPIGLDESGSVLPHAVLTVNTTSAGIADSDRVRIDFAKVARDAIVHDINYVPLETPFLADARAAGCRVVNGLGMLLHQAVPGFELWFGVRPEVSQELYDIIVADVAAEHPA